jgi:hypothetical protein
MHPEGRLGVLNRVLTHAEPGRYGWRSVQLETEGGPPIAQKCRVSTVDDIARRASEKHTCSLKWRCVQEEQPLGQNCNKGPRKQDIGLEIGHCSHSKLVDYTTELHAPHLRTRMDFLR